MEVCYPQLKVPECQISEVFPRHCMSDLVIVLSVLMEIKPVFQARQGFVCLSLIPTKQNFKLFHKLLMTGEDFITYR